MPSALLFTCILWLFWPQLWSIVHSEHFVLRKILQWILSAKQNSQNRAQRIDVKRKLICLVNPNWENWMFHKTEWKNKGSSTEYFNKLPWKESARRPADVTQRIVSASPLLMMLTSWWMCSCSCSRLVPAGRYNSPSITADI